MMLRQIGDQRADFPSQDVRLHLLAGVGATFAAVIGSAILVFSGRPLLVAGTACTLIVLALVQAQARARIAIVMLAILFLAPTTISAFPAVTFSYYACILLAAACLGVRDPSNKWIAWMAVPLVAIPIVSLIASGGSARDLLRTEKPLLAALATCWLTCVLANSKPGEFRAMLRWILWLSVPIAALAIYQRATGTWPVLDGVARITSENFPNRSVGVFGHPIVYGTFTMFAITLAWFFRVFGWQLVISANLIGLLLSGSRGSWVSLIFVVGAYALTRLVSGRVRLGSGRSYANLVALGCLILVIAFAFPTAIGGLGSSLQERLNGSKASVSTEARVTRAKLGIREISRSPRVLVFGHGPNSTVAYWTLTGSLRDGGAATFDDTYVSVAYELGVLGLLLVGGALALLILKRGNVAGSLILLGLAINLYTFDAQSWPVVVAILAIGVAIKQPSDPLTV